MSTGPLLVCGHAMAIGDQKRNSPLRSSSLSPENTKPILDSAGTDFRGQMLTSMDVRI